MGGGAGVDAHGPGDPIVPGRQRAIDRRRGASTPTLLVIFVEILSIAIGAISLLTTLSIKTISAIRGYDRAINQLGRDQERQAIAAQASHDDIRADIADLRRDVDVVFSKMELTKSIASSPRYRSPSVAIED